jgi:hypothetical protein
LARVLRSIKGQCPRGGVGPTSPEGPIPHRTPPDRTTTQPPAEGLGLGFAGGVQYRLSSP